MSPRSCRSTVPATLALVILLTGCGEGPTDPVEPSRVAALALPEGSAVAGSSYLLGDLSDFDFEAGVWTAHIGAREATLLRSTDGAAHVVVPLFIDEASFWSVPPATPVAIEIRRDGEAVARSPEALTVLPPADAPGATESLVRDLGSIVSRLRADFSDMATPEGSVAEAYRHAIPTALMEIVDGHAEHSLAARVSALSESELRLLDAAVEASGARATIAELANAFEVEDRAGMARVLSDLPGTPMDDNELAYLMQLSALTGQFSSDFVSEVAGTFSGTSGYVGLVLLAVLGQDLPAVGEALGIINFVIGLVDVTLSKVVVAMLPTKIVSLELHLDETALEVGETPTAQVQILASNDPPGLTINDVVGQVVNAAAIVSPGGPTTVKDAVEQVVLYLLDRVNALMSTYAELHPELELNYELLSVPDMHWHASVSNHRWLTLLSSSPDVLAPNADAIQWSATSRGTATLSVIPSTSSEAMLHAGYTGGAFGDDIVPSNAVSVTVNGLVLDVQFPTSVQWGQSAPLEVRAGYLESDGVVWSEGIFIDLDVEGGTADLLGASTDPTGSFSSAVHPDPAVSEVSVRVRATDALGEVTETVTAVVVRPVASLTGRHSILFANAADQEGDLVCVNVSDDARFDEPGGWIESIDASCGFTGVTMRAFQDSEVRGPTPDGDGEPGEGLTVRGTGRASFAGPSGYQGPSVQVTASTALTAAFEVLAPGGRLSGTFTLTLPNRRARGTMRVYDTTTRTDLGLWEDDTDGSISVDFPLEEGHRYSVVIAVAYDGDRYSLETEGEASFDVDLMVSGS